MALNPAFNTISEAVEDLKNGKIIIVVDDEDRENEGDLICSSELCTPEMVNFMAVEGRGLVCVSVTPERAQELELEPMVRSNTALHGTKFTVSVDYMHKTTSGISAFDRSATIRAMVDERTKPSDLGRPGHIFPLIAVEGGVLRRAGHTEATVDLMRLAGLKPCGVLCEIMHDDGSMKRGEDLFTFAKKHNMKIITVKDLIAYRVQSDKLVSKFAEAAMPTEFGEFTIVGYQNVVDGKEHVALVKGTWKPDEPVLVRVHSECMTGDVFHSLRCDCGLQLASAMKQISEAGKGVLLYMRQEGRGIGLLNKIRAYALQEQGMDTVQANVALGFQPDARDYGIGAQILVDLGVRKMRLLTNNPTKRVGLESYGLEVVERVPIQVPTNERNIDYMRTKKTQMGHILDIV
jgi:3,4-dihydroxy 2-butanone 4-phosphate synthase / GTP cyclohydrolase II